MTGIVDRFEGNFAVVQLYSGKIIDIAKSKLPMNIKEGYVINVGKNITVNYEETKKRKEEIEKLSKELFKK